MTPRRHGRFLTFFAELRRRRVVRVAGIYLVAAFGLLQGADILADALELPDGTLTVLVVLALAGFPVALLLSWIFDIVPGGIEWTAEESTPQQLHAVGGGTAHADPLRGNPAVVTAARATTTPSVAVVPFLNMSPDPDNEFFTDGVTEDVIAHLSKIRALKVISRSSVMRFKQRERNLREIARELGATTVLDGTVRRSGSRVRVVAELVHPETGQHLWSETYDRELTDVFEIQTDVALHIAEALRAELSADERTRIGKEPTRDLQAYQLYLRGRNWFIHYTPDALNKAIEYFRHAIARDPGYALPHASLAMAYGELVETGTTRWEDVRLLANEAAETSLHLDPTLGEAHGAAAFLKSLWEFDWVGAEEGFRRALELRPNSADAHDLYGRLCGALERYDEALALQRRAQELDPLAHRLDVATTLLRAGRYPEARGEATRAVEVEPAHDRAHATLGWALFLQGRHEEGLAELEQAVELSPETSQWLAQLGQARALAGQEREARGILARLEERRATDFVTPYHLAYVHTGLGAYDRAVDLLERAFDERSGAVYSIKGSFLFAPLRPHPRFRALLARMNLA